MWVWHSIGADPPDDRLDHLTVLVSYPFQTMGANLRSDKIPSANAMKPNSSPSATDDQGQVTPSAQDTETPLRILALQLGCNLMLGGGRYDYEQLEALSRLGHRVRVVAPRHGQHQSTLPSSVEVRWISGRGIRYPITWNVPFLLPTLQECLRWRPDVIRVHSPYAMGVAGLLAGRLTGIPTVVICHHLGDSLHAGRWVEGNLLHRFTGCFCPSQSTADALIAMGVQARRVGWAHNGIASVFTPGPVERAVLARYHLDDESIYFVFMGALIERKNLVWLIREVFGEYFSSGGLGQLVVAGEGPAGPFLRSLTHELKMKNRVIFTGHVQEVEQLTLYRGAAAFVFPSLMEGFGLAPAEAMACGIPTMVSDRGALPELIRSGVTGFVLSIDQGPQPWVECLHRLVGDPALRARMGVAATEYVRQRFSWDSNARRAAAFFASIAARRAR